MKPIKAAAVLAIFCAVTGGDLQACGDKFLVVSRNTRYKRSAPRSSALILIWANPSSSLPLALANVPVDATLRKAGYHPTSVATAAEFEAAIAQGGWDLILADGADCDALRRRLSGDGAPFVLPVLYNATAAELKQAKKLYACVLGSPTKNQAFLDTIDEALAIRPKSAAPAAVAGTTG
jgi:hypothetical protein